MSMSMRYTDSDKLAVVLGEISRECEQAGVNAQKSGAKAVKKAVMNKLQKIKTKDEKQRKRLKHMCDDVVIVTKKDDYGETIVKVQGGKQTGTLWHVVNDGTYRSKATHFMDDALSDVEKELESIVDTELKKVFR